MDQILTRSFFGMGVSNHYYIKIEYLKTWTFMEIQQLFISRQSELKYHCYICNMVCITFPWYYLGSSMFQNLPTISRWLIYVSKLAYNFKIIGTMTKLRQVSGSIFATRKFMYRRQVDIIPSYLLIFYRISSFCSLLSGLY